MLYTNNVLLISAKSWKLPRMEISLLTIQKIESLRKLFNFWSTWPSLAMLKPDVIPCLMEKKSILLKTELYFILLLEIGPISPLWLMVSFKSCFSKYLFWIMHPTTYLVKCVIRKRWGIFPLLIWLFLNLK